MGFGGINIWQLLIILVIVRLLFGTKRLRGLGGDLGSAIKGFKKAMTDENDADKDDPKKVGEDAKIKEENQATKEAVEPEARKTESRQ